ncbi:hypothetical protein [Antribacter gilvus]|uniref:hypothetical protein n=1 Tax=Antribacter gilvus TaxID=2304675 RepID=UPI000F765F19|nr:hypothetical protein [Antribacter gilvus]
MPSQTVTPLRVVAVVAALVVAGAVAVGVGSLLGEDSEQGLGAIPAPPPSSPSPSVSPTPLEVSGPSPEPTTPEELKARNIAEAKARLVEYYATTAEVANAGYADWETKLGQFYGHPEVWRAISRVYQRSAEAGDYSTGAARVESLVVTGYEPSDEGLEVVAIDACVDFESVRSFLADGTEVPRDAATPTRYVISYKMAHQGLRSEWTVNEEVRRAERTC